MKRFFAYSIVFLIAAAVFAVGITDGHLNLDDWGYTAGCAFVRGGLSLANLRSALVDLGHGAIWMPLTFASYMTDFSFFGGGWSVHHAVNVFFHAFNAALVLLFIRTLFGSRVRPCFCIAAALVWALHPMNAETVTWIASRKEELWTLFGILFLLSWRQSVIRGGALRYALSLALLSAALLSKPTAVCLPVLALLVDRLSRSSPGGVASPAKLRYVLPFSFAAVVGLIAWVSQTNPTGMDPIDLGKTTFAWRLLNASVSLGLYLVHFIAPVNLHFDYRAVFGGCPLDASIGITALAIAVLIVVFAAIRRRWTMFVSLSVLASLLPVLGLLGVTGDKAYADRYFYFPSVFIACGLAVFLQWIFEAVRDSQFNVHLKSLAIGSLAVALFAICAAEVALAIPTVRAFGSDRTIYRRVLADDPNHWRALRVLGSEACARDGRFEDGVAMLQRSLRLRPSASTAAALAYVLACRGGRNDFAEVRRLGSSVSRNPRRDREGLMLDALAIAAFRAGDDEEAVRLFGAALAAPMRSHGNLHAMLYYAFALANTARIRQALDLFDKLCGVSDSVIARRARSAAIAVRSGVFARFSFEDPDRVNRRRFNQD